MEKRRSTDNPSPYFIAALLVIAATVAVAIIHFFPPGAV